MSKASNRLLTKPEALEILSVHLRNPKIEPGAMLKLMTIYADLQGWDNEEAPSAEVDIDKLAAEIERQRKAEAK